MTEQTPLEIAEHVFEEHLPLYSSALGSRRWCAACKTQFSDQDTARRHALEQVLLATNTDRPAPCSTSHTPPYDFGVCAMHDTTFPLGGTCKWDGVDSVAAQLQVEVDEQRTRAVKAEHQLELMRTAASTVWIDIHGDVWVLGDDGLMHSPETAPFSREHVEKKWGPMKELRTPDILEALQRLCDQVLNTAGRAVTEVASTPNTEAGRRRARADISVVRGAMQHYAKSLS
ncbi:hypothetical protein EDF62_1554 [Leucobacter luti]|uniref:Uncharacterized protein n=1 Tax=Leucobacter luti TaxID=340320 RepID=A0A4V3CY10_9MICO|nr:hypothetical protein [Leucobacter luti]TDP92348.1 hypothetical protein EDF62_1554 [Leucobacter luti]